MSSSASCSVIEMKRGVKFLLLGALGLGLAACAAPADYSTPYATYGYAVPYSVDFYGPIYGGIAWDGWRHDWDHRGWDHHGGESHGIWTHHAAAPGHAGMTAHNPGAAHHA